MKKYELTSNDYGLIKRIVIITRSIISTYYYLLNLENDGNKNSEEYDMVIDELKVAIEMENELYRNIQSAEKASAVINYLMGFEDVTFEDYLYLIFNNSSEEMIKRRMLCKLENIINTKEFEKEDNEDVYESIREEDIFKDGIDNDEDIEQIEILDENPEKTFFMYNIIENAIETDLINTILKILQEHINNPDYNSIKYPLIEFKYLLSLVFIDIEKELLENKFEIRDTLIWTSTIYADFYKIGYEELQIFKSNYSDDLLEESRTTLISILDKLIEEIPDIKDSDYFVDATISEIILRASLLFASPDEIYNYTMLIENDLKQIESKNDGIEPIIRLSIDSYNEDKCLPSILSLKQKN